MCSYILYECKIAILKKEFIKCNFGSINSKNWLLGETYLTLPRLNFMFVKKHRQDV